MHFNRSLASAIALSAFLAACSDTALVEPALDASPSLASAPYGVDASLVRVGIGETHQLTASNHANGKAVPNSSVNWTSSNPAVATVSGRGLVTGVSRGEAVVTVSRGAHSEQVTVIVDGCSVTPLASGSTEAEITEGDCVFAFNAARLADYYSVTTAPAEVVEFLATGMAGSLGYKEATADPRAGQFYGQVGTGVRMRVISNGGELQPFFAAAEGTVGSYTISRTAPAEPHQCGSAHVFRPGVSFTASLTAANSCEYPVEHGIDEAMGMPLHAHYFNMYVQAGQTYTVTITGVSESFNPALSVFGDAVWQSVPDGTPAPSSRSVTFTPGATGYVGVEVASGHFDGGLEPEYWVIQHGTYSMTVTQ